MRKQHTAPDLTPTLLTACFLDDFDVQLVEQLQQQELAQGASTQ
jgi:hypothetical protein